MERIRIEEQEKHDEENRQRKLRGLPSIEEEEAKKKAKLKAKEESVEGDEVEKKTEAPEEEEPAESQESEEDKWKPYIPETPSRICWAIYSSTDTFWLSMDNYDAGYLYECRFTSDAEKAKMSMSVIEKVDEPFKSVAVLQSDLTGTDDIPLSCMIQE